MSEPSRVLGASRAAACRRPRLLCRRASGTPFLPRAICHASAVILSGGLFSSAAAGEENIIELSDVGVSVPGFRIDGERFRDASGFSVSGAGDVNGDGLSDLIVGSPFADGGLFPETDSGKAHVVQGKTDFASVSLRNELGLRISGLVATTRSGILVSCAGDLNGDELDDTLLGTFEGDILDPTGKSYVVFGRTYPDSIILEPHLSSVFRLNEVEEGDVATFASGVGDVNADGLGDLAVGANRADPDGRTNAGETYIVFGGDAELAEANLADVGMTVPGFRIKGRAPNDYSGVVSGAGDVNGDGLADIVIGAFWADPSGNQDAGEAYVIFGKPDSASVDLEELESSGSVLGFQIDGIDADDWMGRSVSGAGDVNGDGLADITVAAHRADPGGRTDAGEVYVVLGRANPERIDLADLGEPGNEAGFRIEGVEPGDRAGNSVSGVGDFNGDGLSDIIIGAYYRDRGEASQVGETYLVFGKRDTSTIELSQLAAGGLRLWGLNPFDRSGQSAAGAGDVNGDGIADVIIGAPYAEGGKGEFTGESYVVFGPGPGISIPEEATYRAFAAPGDPPRLAVGVIGDGSNDSTPDARFWIDFAAGDDGAGGASLETITLTRNNAAVTGLNAPPADVMWRWETARIGAGPAQVTLKYTGSEVTNVTRSETDLRMLTAAAPTGPWTLLDSTVDAAKNRVTAVVPGPGFLILAPTFVTSIPLEGFKAD